MSYDNEFVAAKLRRWESYLGSYELPGWEQLPDIGLYMEQVLDLLKSYLSYLPPELKEEQFITAPAINNYVRKKIIPKPVRKRYYRVHLAYLIIICTMKHCLSLSTLQTLLPCGLGEEEMKALYSSYIARHKTACRLFLKTAGEIGAHLLGESEGEFAAADPEELLITSAVFSGFARILTEKLLLLGDTGNR